MRGGCKGYFLYTLLCRQAESYERCHLIVMPGYMKKMCSVARVTAVYSHR